MGAFMTWLDRLSGRSARPVSRTRRWGTPRYAIKDIVHWFAKTDPDELAELRTGAEAAQRRRPKDSAAHAAVAAALIASVRAGVTDDLDEDAVQAIAAAEQALALAPRDPFVKAIAAPALVYDDPERALDLLAAARLKLGSRLPFALARAAEEGPRRPTRIDET